MVKKEEQRKRRFCLTWNNYKTGDLELIKKVKYSYIIVGQEIGVMGTKHYQIYIEFKEGKTFSCMKKKFKRCHIEVAKGTADVNREYCSKELIIFEDGVITEQGKRNDLKEIKNSCKEGKGIREMLEDETIKNYQGLRTAEALMKYVEP